jgi:hypothetical protein
MWKYQQNVYVKEYFIKHQTVILEILSVIKETKG